MRNAYGLYRGKKRYICLLLSEWIVTMTIREKEPIWIYAYTFCSKNILLLMERKILDMIWMPLGKDREMDSAKFNPELIRYF